MTAQEALALYLREGSQIIKAGTFKYKLQNQFLVYINC